MRKSQTEAFVTVDPVGGEAPAGRRWAGSVKTSREIASSVGYGALGVVIVLSVWWAVSQQIGPLRLPDPWRVARAIFDNWRSIPALQYVIMQPGGLGDSLIYTVESVLMTVAMGSVAGIIVGVAIPYFTPLRLALTPVLVVLGTIPVLILLPFLVQWFGNGQLVLSGLVIVFTFVLIATMAQNSIETATGQYSDYARSLGAGRLFEVTNVAIPALVPDLASGIRVSLAAAWSFQTVAELIGGKHGAGRIIAAMANLSNTTLVLAMVVCVAVAAVVIDAIFMILASRIQRWRP